MNLHIFDTAEQIAVAVGNMMIEQLNEKPDSVMGFADRCFSCSYIPVFS